MDTSRRDFLRKAALLSGAAGLSGILPESIQKALAITPPKNSTYLDAEHIVFLMQENRSFDHCFGSLRGVRGFDDPRAISLPSQYPVWLQTNKEGQTFAPWRLNMKESKATWMSGLPHSWEDQVDALNNGKHDQWLNVKRSGNKAYAAMPLTLGYYNRQDIPFYYAMADAFTVCDQYFCSALTGTTPNRLFFWTGKLRENENDQARVRNGEVDYNKKLKWTTFPERLEQAGISWRIYQNELSLPSGFKGEQDSWLSNFTDNPLEWFQQYKVEKKNQDLSGIEKNLHEKAFTTNKNDPNYRELTSMQYNDGDTVHSLQVPKGDILHQFRQDVTDNKLPTVSWLVAPEKFSDHPGAPWYGAWYVSEVLDILTQNPEVWKKTIFIVNYDENDGIFDHVPPFTAPQPGNPATGFVSKGIDAAIEYVSLDSELKYNTSRHARQSPVGLGFRVPMIIASPWSRGGWVNSQVFDHTSCLQFLEHFLAHKGFAVTEDNISSWRRAVCGDLSSVFRPYKGEKIHLPEFLPKEELLQTIHQAQFRDIPGGFHAFTPEEINAVQQSGIRSGLLPRQEKGARPSCALPYELYADAQYTAASGTVAIRLEAANTVFGSKSAGAPFLVYAPGNYKTDDGSSFETARNWSFAVKAGEAITPQWPLAAFELGRYHLSVYGPNGFYRAYRGDAGDPSLECSGSYDLHGNNAGDIMVLLHNTADIPYTIHLKQYAYAGKRFSRQLQPGESHTVRIASHKTAGWYDFAIVADGFPFFEKRFAGRVETGRPSTSDPLIGGEPDGRQ
ncbi:phosphocholine-specific phospholipase C [Filimonas effusa]|uniref:phospholipase C n=1 Tax=Filimonas effusa TaxID=2508721 RepID=A0A4Q1D8A4_9BACT|nr:phospholipase C, phosphocholine-specific [Filimonas effusa]RXK85420.1 phospholipase C, phosphocholine-specific [Filimonas effusa]